MPLFPLPRLEFEIRVILTNRFEEKSDGILDFAALPPAGEQQRQAETAERIDAGQVRAVIADLRSYQGTGQERARRLADYLHRFRECVPYDAFQEQGLPIGSGEVESAHRFIPQKRLKLPGACWRPQTLNPMLALRVLRANGWWEAFWKAKNAA